MEKLKVTEDVSVAYEKPALAEAGDGRLHGSSRALILAKLFEATGATTDSTEVSKPPAVEFPELDKIVRISAKRALPAGEVEKDLVDLYNDGFVDIHGGVLCELTSMGVIAGMRLCRITTVDRT